MRPASGHAAPVPGPGETFRSGRRSRAEGAPVPPPGLIGKVHMDGFLVALVISFGVIFVAELGDKSQLMALTFATRFKPVPVLIGITIATAIVHLASVGIGYGLHAA